MVAMLITVGGWQHIALRPQLTDRISQRLPGLGAAVRANSLITWLRLEAMLAVLALLAVAWLSATPIPEPQNLQINQDTTQATQTIDNLSITAAVLPEARASIPMMCPSAERILLSPMPIYSFSMSIRARPAQSLVSC